MTVATSEALLHGGSKSIGTVATPTKARECPKPHRKLSGLEVAQTAIRRLAAKIVRAMSILQSRQDTNLPRQWNSRPAPTCPRVACLANGFCLWELKCGK